MAEAGLNYEMMITSGTIRAISTSAVETPQRVAYEHPRVVRVHRVAKFLDDRFQRREVGGAAGVPDETELLGRSRLQLIGERRG